MELNIKPGYYLHFKGHVYLLMSVAQHTETNEVLVIYGNLDRMYARPFKMFLDTVEHNGETVSRFKFIGETLKEAEEYLRALS